MAELTRLNVAAAVSERQRPSGCRLREGGPPSFSYLYFFRLTPHAQARYLDVSELDEVNESNQVLNRFLVS